MAAPSKVNLRLRVGPREPSGYHRVDTLLVSLHLADTITLRPISGACTLKWGFARPLTRMPDLGPEDENLALRAARAFLERAGLGNGAEITLLKRIPVGAGLGGGSSDAAAVLRALDRLNPGRLTATELTEIGAGLGSDVPFFVTGAPLARATGRGERVAPVPALPRRFVVVAVPDFPVGTAEAYGWLDQDRPADLAPMTFPGPEPGESDWETVAAEAANDFEGPVFQRHPELETIRDGLREAGALLALLAGSGSTVFGVFEGRDEARTAATAVREVDPGLRTLVTRTRTN